jgi:hypothetical protein
MNITTVIHRHNIDFYVTLGVKYICTGLNENTMRQFWQYARTTLNDALLTKYAENKPVYFLPLF